MRLIHENEYDFRKRLTKLYDEGALVSDKEVGKDEICLKGGVVFSGVNGEVLEKATKEFTTFLKIEGNVFKVCKDTAITVEFISNKETLGEFAEFKGRAITIEDGKITINGNDERGQVQALYDIEKELKRNGCLHLRKGEYKNKPAFSPRMVHSSYGLDIFPDEYLLNLVKEGVDSIILFCKGINKNRVGDFDFNNTIERAKSFGLDTYAYCNFMNFVSPYAENAEKIYEEVYTNFFKAHNGFKGMIFVGESVEFPSIDPNVEPRHHHFLNEDNMKGDKPTPGWWPCVDYPDWLELIKKSIRKAKPDAEIIFWTYNWGYVNEEDRINLIEKLPTDISLLVTFEMFEKYKLGRTQVMGCDYSLAVAGPGKYFISEAEAAKKRGIKLYAMSNSGGRTWDFGMLPVEYVPEQWKKRYDAMLKCREDYNLKGVMECHHYGFTPSFISRFEYYAFTITDDKRNYDTDSCLLIAMKERFGENAEKVREVMRKMTAVIETYPPTDEMQYGPMRIGTAYPLCLNENLKPKEEENLLFGLKICFNTLHPLDLGRFAPFSMRVRSDIKLHKENIKRLSKIISELEEISNPNVELLRLINTIKYMKCMFATCKNAYEFYIERHKLMIAETKREINKTTAKIRKIAQNEIENAKESIEYAEKDSSIGYEPSMGYVASPKRIAWKIKQVNRMLKAELSVYERNLF